MSVLIGRMHTKRALWLIMRSCVRFGVPEGHRQMLMLMISDF